ncbi:hypothetical protein [Thermococcus piezophilus]|uniref:hypothetical protein n=1 Tax=Thermococcus piezophilus TaxID=1712654 RepID=UPI001F2C465E|nr:hypothetical protein [Thermococcus piezophilus]
MNGSEKHCSCDGVGDNHNLECSSLRPKKRLNAKIEARRDCDRSWVHLVTFSTLVDVQFHSKNALDAVHSNSTDAFNLSTVELERDFLGLYNHLVETAIYLELDTLNDSVLEMTNTGPCIDF